MKRFVLVLAAFAVVTITQAAVAQEVVSDWAGRLEVAPGTRLPLVVHIKRDDAGALSGTLDSPARNVQGLPLADIKAGAGSSGETQTGRLLERLSRVPHREQPG